MQRLRRFRIVRPTSLVFCCAICLCLAVSTAGAQETVFTFDPAATKIEFTLGATLHTVHGTMKLKSGEIRFDPATGKASGKVIVDATSAETGNGSRDKKMHKEVLESAKYPEIVFTPTQVTGAIRTIGASQVQVSGEFQLHGQEHPMTLAVNVERGAAGEPAKATTKFVVPYVQWGLKNPSTLFLRVSDHVDMEIDATGQLTTVPD
jgi:polyisoprenoid-binding protein YceI